MRPPTYISSPHPSHGEDREEGWGWGGQRAELSVGDGERREGQDGEGRGGGGGGVRVGRRDSGDASQRCREEKTRGEEREESDYWMREGTGRGGQ